MTEMLLRTLIKEIADSSPAVIPGSVIYCDMDGVLVDFESGTVELLNSVLDGGGADWVRKEGRTWRQAIRRLHREMGPDWRASTRADLDIKPVRNFMFAVIKDNPGAFFGALPALSDGVDQLWPYINSTGHTVKLLTAGVSGRAEGMTSEQGKTAWAMENLSPPPGELIMMPASQKAEYATEGETANILIDDKPSTISSWVDRGGIGILHSPGGSASTIKQLREMGV